MPLLPQDVWHINRRVSILAVDESDCMLIHLASILAIALSRLRMTVEETIFAFNLILNSMYANPRKVVPLTTKYSHSNLETALASMSRQHCKQHERGLCNQDHLFWYDITGTEHLGNDSDDSDGVNTSSSESAIRAFVLQRPEYQLCQT